MRITRLIMILIVMFTVLASVNIFLSMMASRTKDEMTDAYDARRIFTLAMHDLRIASSDLTRISRAYVIRGAAFQLAEFDMRLPIVAQDGYVWQTFDRYGAPENEMYLLSRVLEYQAYLRTLDKQAIEARQLYGDIALGLEISYHDDYITSGFAFIAAAQELESVMRGRTQGMIDTAVRRGEVFSRASQLSAVLFAVFSVLGTLYISRAVKASTRREREAEEESRAKTQFLAQMSHEIRTPMNAILGTTELQLQRDDLLPQTEGAFSLIYSSSRLLLAIINDILDISKVEAGKMEITPAVYEMVSLVVDTVQLNLMHIGSKRIDFKLEIDERFPANLVGDELRIKQILNNLLSNAFKYTHEGQITLSFGVEIAEHHDEIMMVIRVQDTGQGMTKEQIDNLFEIEFTRFDVQRNRAIEGSGLGMSITDKLITMMRGEITVNSELGAGSTFTVRIPQTPHGGGTIGKAAVENLQSLDIMQNSLKKIAKFTCEPMPYGRVLVVDDVESNLYVVKGFLMPYKIAVETVTSGYDAVEKVKAGEVYDIIFMDHMMPGMDGIEAAKIIREMGYDQPIVALTANVVKGAADIFLSNGFDGCVPKPIDLNLLNKCLLRYIRDKQPPEVIEETQTQVTKKQRWNSDAEISAELSGKLSDRLIVAFLLDAQKALGFLEPIVRNQNFDEAALRNFVIQTHAMKSTLHNIGCIELSEAALVLEKASRSVDIDTIKESAPQFLDNLRELITELSPDDDKDRNDADDLDFLRNQLDIIANACEQFDFDVANTALDQLDQKHWPKNTKELVKAISTGLLYGELKKAAVLARQSAEL